MCYVNKVTCGKCLRVEVGGQWCQPCDQWATKPLENSISLVQTQEKWGMEAWCPFPTPGPMHLFHLAIPFYDKPVI